MKKNKLLCSSADIQCRELHGVCSHVQRRTILLSRLWFCFENSSVCPTAEDFLEVARSHVKYRAPGPAYWPRLARQTAFSVLFVSRAVVNLVSWSERHTVKNWRRIIDISRTSVSVFCGVRFLRAVFSRFNTSIMFYNVFLGISGRRIIVFY